MKTDLNTSKIKSESLEQKLKDQDAKISYIEKKLETQKQIGKFQQGTDDSRDVEYEGDMTSGKYNENKRAIT